MVFASPKEVIMAWQLKKVARHAVIKLRLSRDKRVKGEGAEDYRPGQLIVTTVGRVLFNEALHPSMAFYNITLKSRDLASVISDCYLELGRRATIELLDRMKEFGFQESTRSGISFATSDLVTASNKEKVIAESEALVLRLQKSYDRGLMTSGERYNKVIDVWTHAREQITESMKVELEHDLREEGAYVNPIYLMADSGARGGIEQIRQLAGMRGLMAKPSGEIIETPIKSNFREGPPCSSTSPRRTGRARDWPIRPSRRPTQAT
jgi:DNA-directed RNA polymerase subunit beta'